jgi:ubiquinone/menaquinone biosynthesis C-methylase UbiE
MDIFENILGNISGGFVLDVATLEGRFVQILMENLKDYHEIVGIDINEPAIENAREALGQGNIRFLMMNAECLEFEDESFDTVCISACSGRDEASIEIKWTFHPCRDASRWSY